MVMPFTTVQKRITGTFWLDDIFVSAISRSAMPEALKEIEQLLRERHHITASEDPDFNVRSPEELLQAQLAASRILTMLLGTTAFLALLVGGIGIMNIMLVSVTQRTREIGVRMAVGATERDVQAQFLSEAMVLSVIGAVLGVAVGIAFSYIVDSVFLFPAKLTTETLLIGGLFSPLIGIVFGFYPAWKASQLDPIQGLRFE